MLRALLAIALLLVLPRPAPCQAAEDEARGAFMSAVQDCNGRRMLGLLCAASAAEAAGAADSLESILTGMDPPALGEFFAGLGLEAAPGEIGCWEDADFLEVLLLSSDFDTSWVSTEQVSTGAWRIRTKDGVFQGMLEELSPAEQTEP